MVISRNYFPLDLYQTVNSHNLMKKTQIRNSYCSSIAYFHISPQGRPLSVKSDIQAKPPNSTSLTLTSHPKPSRVHSLSNLLPRFRKCPLPISHSLPWNLPSSPQTVLGMWKSSGKGCVGYFELLRWPSRPVCAAMGQETLKTPGKSNPVNA